MHLYHISEKHANRIPLKPGHRFFPDCLRETYARWIEWAMKTADADSWFVTLTFKYEIKERKSHALLMAWLKNLELAYYNKTGSRRLRYIIATEWQKREVIHYHLLICGVGLRDLSRKRWESRWESLDVKAGFCRIYDAVNKSAPYLAKYMNKGGEIKWGGYWQGLKTPKSTSCCQIDVGVKVQGSVGS